MPIAWIEGKRELGCVCHKLARFRHSAGNTQVDVFVMPRIARQRPIAVTIGHYPVAGEAQKRKLRFEGSDIGQDTWQGLQDVFKKLGYPPTSIEQYAREVGRFLVNEGQELARVLAGATGGEGL